MVADEDWEEVNSELSGSPDEESEEDQETFLNESYSSSDIAKRKLNEYTHDPKSLIEDAGSISEEYHNEIMLAGLGTAAISYLVWGVGIEDTGRAVEPIINDEAVDGYIEPYGLTTDDIWDDYFEAFLQGWREVGNSNTVDLSKPSETIKAPFDKIGHFLVGRSLVSASYRGADGARKAVKDVTGVEIDYDIKEYTPLGGASVGSFMAGKELGIEGLTVAQALTTGDAVGDWIMDMAGGAEGARADEKKRYEKGEIESYGEYRSRAKEYLAENTPLVQADNDGK